MIGMKKNKIFAVITVVFTLCCLPLTVYANSSWHWISETQPWDLLPIVIVITLLIEIAAVNFIPKIRNLKLVIPVVGLANLLSFLFPYFYTAVDPGNPYNVYCSGDYLESIAFGVSHGPFYTVSTVYLVITLLVETPIVYLFFRNRVKSRRLLLGVIIGANVLTTAITCVIERMSCYGVW